MLFACGNKDQNKQVDYERHQKSALAYIQSGQYKAAALEAQNMIKALPDNSGGYQLLSQIYNDTGAYKATQNLLNGTVEKLPQLAQLLADSYLKSGKYSSAVEVLNKYPADKTNKDAYLAQQKSLALASIFLGDKAQYDSALENFTNQGGAKLDQLTLQAINAYSRGKLEEADRMLKQGLSLAPTNVEILKWLGTISAATNKLDQAESYLTQALGQLKNSDIITADRSQVTSQLIEVLIQLGRSSEAYTYQKMLAQANPEGSAAQQQFNEALEYYQQGKFDEAEKILSQLRKDFPKDSNTATLQGLIDFQQGADSNAEDLFDEFVDPETANASIIQAAALVKFRVHKADEALELLKAAAERQPNNATVQASYGLALLDKDKTSEQGAKALEKSLAINPQQNRLRLALAKRYSALDQPEQALGQLQKAYRNEPQDLLLQQNYFKALLDAGMDADIEQEIANFKKNYPDSTRGELMSGWFHARKKQWSSAESDFRQALAKSETKEKELAYAGLAQVFEQQQQYAKAMAQLQEAISLSPESVGLYRMWLKDVVQLKKQDEAISFLSGIESKSGGWPASVVLAQLLASSQKLPEAINHLERALPKSNDNENVKRLLAGLYKSYASQLKSSGDITGARQDFLKASRLFPESPELVANLIFLELDEKNFDEAQRILNEFAKENSNQPEYFYMQGAIQIAQGKTQAALESYQKSWALKPLEATAEQLYKFKQGQGDEKAREVFLQEWAQKIPQSYKPNLMLALSYQQQGNSDAAISWYEKTLALAPKLPAAANNLAWLYYEKGDERALKLAEMAATLSPSSPEILDTYGWILLGQGQAEQAVDVLKKAAQLAPDNTEIKAHLQEAQKKLK